MLLSQALALVQRAQSASRRRGIFLATGFQPLHLVTFLRANAAQRLPDESLEVQTGLYGDLLGNLARAATSSAEAAAVVIEWSDLDPRLGLRRSGGFGPGQQQDIAANCENGWACLRELLGALAKRMPVALALPTLPTPLFGHTTGWQMSTGAAELDLQVAGFATQLTRLNNLRVVSPAPTWMGRSGLESSGGSAPCGDGTRSQDRSVPTR